MKPLGVCHKLSYPTRTEIFSNLLLHCQALCFDNYCASFETCQIQQSAISAKHNRPRYQFLDLSTVLSSILFDNRCLQVSTVLRLIVYIQVSDIITNQNMIEKVFLNGERAIPSVQAPSVKRAELASTSRKNPVSEELPFYFGWDLKIFSEI